jgi:hypothetical protein
MQNQHTHTDRNGREGTNSGGSSWCSGCRLGRRHASHCVMRSTSDGGRSNEVLPMQPMHASCQRDEGTSRPHAHLAAGAFRRAADEGPFWVRSMDSTAKAALVFSSSCHSRWFSSNSAVRSRSSCSICTRGQLSRATQLNALCRRLAACSGVCARLHASLPPAAALAHPAVVALLLASWGSALPWRPLHPGSHPSVQGTVTLLHAGRSDAACAARQQHMRPWSLQ